MAKEYLKDYKLNFTGIVILEEFYSYIKGWLEKQGYWFDEPNYREIQQGKKKTIMIRWMYAKKYNDYIQQKIDINFNLKDAEEVKTKKKTAHQTTVEMTITAFLDKDYEEKWEKSKILKFVSEVYDRYAGRKSELERSGEELINDAENFYNEIKAYLKVTQ
ncbi:MAG: hypothetical protein Q7R56_00695 [Nanoarchaeota archaeon]|nr:hypothetical protein [Nanoarchaeota archaeon]